MTTRDAYVALLEKRAASEGDVLPESITPNTEGADHITQEHSKNREDHRAYLHSIFSNAESVQRNQSSELHKLFPDAPGNVQTSNPLIKMAFRQVFFGALEGNGEFLKTASPVHLEVTYNAFVDELEKISYHHRNYNQPR